MGAGALVVVNDTPENCEVVGDSGLLLPFREVDRLAGLMEEICGAPQKYESLRCQARQRIARSYDWEKVVDQYEELFYGLVNRDFTQRRRDAERGREDSVTQRRRGAERRGKDSV